MKFLFECEDEVCLPAAYRLVDEIKPFLDKIKQIDIPDGEKLSRKESFRKILENIMLRYPKETGEVLSKLWVLEDGEKAPNAFKTVAYLVKCEEAVDFFASVLPSILALSKELSPLLKSKN